MEVVIGARFAHVNLIAEDWRRLARFYVQVLGCVPVPPERRLEGEQLARATDIPEAKIQGVHLRLPGFEDAGPTLEIFEYDQRLDSPPVAANQRGLGHIAFAVDDVKAARNVVLAAGGSSVGELVTLAVSESCAVTFAYVRDPEGNIIELQRWSTLSIEDDGVLEV
jgi:catechol 2,3-dioxygenase-like lactoylglutathione lyase family enzyme